MGEQPREAQEAPETHQGPVVVGEVGISLAGTLGDLMGMVRGVDSMPTVRRADGKSVVVVPTEDARKVSKLLDLRGKLEAFEKRKAEYSGEDSAWALVLRGNLDGLPNLCDQCRERLKEMAERAHLLAVEKLARLPEKQDVLTKLCGIRETENRVNWLVKRFATDAEPIAEDIDTVLLELRGALASHAMSTERALVELERDRIPSIREELAQLEAELPEDLKALEEPPALELPLAELPNAVRVLQALKDPHVKGTDQVLAALEAVGVYKPTQPPPKLEGTACEGCRFADNCPDAGNPEVGKYPFHCSKCGTVVWESQEDASGSCPLCGGPLEKGTREHAAGSGPEEVDGLFDRAGERAQAVGKPTHHCPGCNRTFRYSRGTHWSCPHCKTPLKECVAEPAEAES